MRRGSDTISRISAAPLRLTDGAVRILDHVLGSALPGHVPRPLSLGLRLRVEGVARALLALNAVLPLAVFVVGLHAWVRPRTLRQIRSSACYVGQQRTALDCRGRQTNGRQ